ncbi:MAG TPA: hypothetical protein VIG47_15315, partial [Gemmatimonadaceae bacterium]
FIVGDVDAKAASAMFMGTIFSDAMGRDAMPDIYPSPPGAAVDRYTTLILAAIGVTSHPEIKIAEPALRSPSHPAPAGISQSLSQNR